MNLPALSEQQVRSASLPVNYEAAKTAIAQCERIDECKDWADKAAAIASYARQAKDTSLRDAATRIRLRALRRVGELLERIPAQPGKGPGGGTNPESRTQLAARAGISRHSATDLLSIAKIPDAKYEEAISTSPPPQMRELTGKAGRDRKRYGETFMEIMGHPPYSFGLSALVRWTDKHPPVPSAGKLSADEANRIRPLLRKLEAWIDEFDRRMTKRGDK